MKGHKTVLERVKSNLAYILGFSLTETTPLYINDTTLRSDVRGYIVEAFNSNAQFSTLNVKNEHGGSNGLSNMTLPDGRRIYANIQDIQLSSGEVIVYTR